MKLYNTLTRNVEAFKATKDNLVSLYTCGPTVYDYPHIGNWRSFIFDDTLRRVLELSGFEVKHVMNITDVGHLTSDGDEGQDKLEAGAKREGKSAKEVANFYSDVFVSGAKALTLFPPNGYGGPSGPYARATDFIEEQIEIVKLLLAKNFAYPTEQAIYFDISKLSSYGELSGQRLEDKEIGARDEVVTDTGKRRPQDFAVWFFTKGRFANHEMHWSSPWGEGFPGWHLECSAIIHATLGDPIDIHTGGVDHIGTHHPNEMAQTEAAFSNELARVWMHNEFVLVDGQKMAKSLGNFITLDEITKRGYHPLALRLLFLQAHYRRQMNFTWEALDGAQNRLKVLRGVADLRWQPISRRQGEITIADSVAVFDEYENRVRASLDSNLDTPKSLTVISEMEANLSDSLLGKDQIDRFNDFLRFLDHVFGLELSKSSNITDTQRELIESREAARRSQDWSRADEVRESLQKQGIEINDTPHGPIWSRSSGQPLA